jgi:chemotaxis methyl-accepting protein methylase
MEPNVDRICRLVWERYHKDIHVFDESFLETSIRRRAEIRNEKILEDYSLLCSKDIHESDTLLDSLYVGFSEFFRNPLTFACIEQIVLPSLIEKKKRSGSREIRIWSAACSIGQEAYSLAILCNELLENSLGDLKCRIFATDIHEDFLSLARRAVYQESSIGKVSFERIRTNFTSHEDMFELNPGLKSYVDFSRFDLLDSTIASPEPSIYGNFDIALCCNVLFYYSKAPREQILDRLASSLAPDGYLVSGEVERDMVINHAFTEVIDRSALYKKGKKK